MNGISQSLAGYYIQKGYLARVVIPPQEIKGGIVEIQIIEGQRGSLNIDNQGQRLNAARLTAFIDTRVAADAPLNLAALGEAMNILNEQPGVDAKVAIVPGKGEGKIGLNVTAKDKPLTGYTLGFNNQGSRGTGEYQWSGGINLNNPSGNLDAASLLFNASEGSTYARADYRIAVGNNGLQLGVNTSHLDYNIVQSGLTALKPNGTASTSGLSASYPLARRSDWNLSLTGSYDDKTLIDKTTTGETGNRHVTVTNLGIAGYTMGSAVGGAMLSFGASLSLGDSDQRNASARATDATTRKVQGNFTKLAYNLGYLRPLNADWTLNAALRGQFAAQNLDSTERMSLGGPNAVRAYPVGESSGDEAWIVSLNLGRKLSSELNANFFLDSGTVRLNKNTWTNWNSTNPRQPNSYTLNGIGAGLDWRINRLALLTASVAVPLGSNPGRDANDLNADGSPQSRVRGWLALNAQF